MAQFRATISGQRGEASRLGSKNSCMRARVNGCDGGVEIRANVDAHGHDVFAVYATSGSNGRFSDKYLGYIDGSGEWFPGTPWCKVAA